jgi:hypothetical protein
MKKFCIVAAIGLAINFLTILPNITDHVPTAGDFAPSIKTALFFPGYMLIAWFFWTMRAGYKKAG